MTRTVGILGGGQLGRMLALAGYPLGITCRVYDPAPDACAGQVAPHYCGAYHDWQKLTAFAEGVECLTYEFENVPLDTALWLAERVPVRPTPEALRLFQDRLLEKQTLQAQGVPVPAFAEVDPHQPLHALQQVGLPAVLKTRRFGYDGKGQALVRTQEEYLQAVQKLGSRPLIVEAFVPFERELSLIAVRSLTGEMRFYPLVENHHRASDTEPAGAEPVQGGGILRLTLAPAPHLTPELQAQAEQHARTVMEHLEYVGVMAIEWFQVGTQLLANEVAPRVHNSGHWTIEGAETSQFENHLRAIVGLPLGSVGLRGYSAMVNLVGTIPPIESVLAIPNTHLHLYGKSPRHGRKVGHITLRTDTEAERDHWLAQIWERLQCPLP